MKNKYDERQSKEIHDIGIKAFYVMFLLNAAAVVVQLIFFNYCFANIIGETAALIGGGCIYLIGCIKKGLFTTNRGKYSIGSNLITSILFSGVFSVFYGIAMNQKVSAMALGKYVGYFFVGISILCFITLTLMGFCSRRSEKMDEKQYMNWMYSKGEYMGELKALCTINDQIQAEILLDILKQNGIVAYKESVGSSEIMNIYAGNSNMGERIIINQDDFLKATELANCFFAQDGAEEFENDSKNISVKSKKPFSRKRVLSIIVLVFFVVVTIFFSYFNMK